jgi:hypothetical protein
MLLTGNYNGMGYCIKDGWACKYYYCYIGSTYEIDFTVPFYYERINKI